MPHSVCNGEALIPGRCCCCTLTIQLTSFRLEHADSELAADAGPLRLRRQAQRQQHVARAGPWAATSAAQHVLRIATPVRQPPYLRGLVPALTPSRACCPHGYAQSGRQAACKTTRRALVIKRETPIFSRVAQAAIKLSSRAQHQPIP